MQFSASLPSLAEPPLVGTVGGAVEIRIARSREEIETLRQVWTAWPTHRDSDIDFYLMIIQSYAEVLRPHVIALYRNGRPDAILVGRLERKRVPFRVGYFRAFRPWAHCLTFVYGALHGSASSENAEILVREVMKSLKQGDADVAVLEFVPLDSSLYRPALELPGVLGRDTFPVAQGHSILALPDDIEGVYRRMSGVRRKHIRSGIKKLSAHASGTERIVCYRTEAELDRLFRDAEEVAKQTYQRGLGVGFADTRDVRMRLELAARKGWLRAYILYLGERPCAFWIGMLYDDAFISEYLGYDAEMRRLSPGMFLMMNVIERFCNHADGDAVRTLDFGLGTAEYKEVLASHEWLEAAVYIFAPTPRGLLLKFMRTTARIVNGTSKKILGSTNLLSRAKRLWRDHLARRTQTL